jgi:hypothetical protein
MKSYTKTGKRLEILLANAYRRPEVEEMIEAHFFSSMELPTLDHNDIYPSLPYWVDIGSVDNRSGDTEMDDYIVQFRNGHHEPLFTRTDFREGSTMVHNRQTYTYVDSVSLPAEIELQADDGKYVVAYRGESYLRVWERHHA